MLNKTITLTRVFDAPREQVWRAWTDPERIKLWWGPKAFTAPSIKNDLRIGGTYLYAMKDAEGKLYWSTGTYKDVRYLEKIVATDSFADEKGHIVSPAEYGMPNMKDELELTVTFEDKGNQTKLTIVHKDFPANYFDQCVQGWNESLDKLDDVLRNERPAELNL
ncbi:SRPBCC family protein [uncultured Bdellovibrio sp.]|uniref:SRPBCC family protein n=1 Tax=Bdellovibrio sp. HCB-162 TaxID=3394234 RepID=UPI0025F3A89C|nr:SRPBCC domain-containing protein [uncultured Bdellovibrio sp.]